MAMAARASDRVSVTVVGAMAARASVGGATGMAEGTATATVVDMAVVMDTGAAEASDHFPYGADPTEPARSAVAGFLMRCLDQVRPRHRSEPRAADGKGGCQVSGNC